MGYWGGAEVIFKIFFIIYIYLFSISDFITILKDYFTKSSGPPQSQYYDFHGNNEPFEPKDTTTYSMVWKMKNNLIKK